MKQIFLFLSIFFFIANHTFTGDIVATPSSQTSPSNVVNPYCAGSNTVDNTYYATDIRARYSGNGQDIEFEVFRTNGANFLASGRLYVKDGKSVCGSVLGDVYFSSSSSKARISLNRSLLGDNPRDFTLVVIYNVVNSQGKKPKVNAGTIRLLYECVDYEVSNITTTDYSPYTGQENVRINIDVRNRGNVRGSDYVHLFLSKDRYQSSDDEYLGRTYFSLDANYRNTVHDYVDYPNSTNFPPGDYYILAIADENNGDGDCNRSNNLTYQRITLEGRPDFHFSRLSPSKTTICRNDDLNIDFAVRNKGTKTPSANVLINFYLSKDKTNSSDDFEVGFTDIYYRSLDSNEEFRNSNFTLRKVNVPSGSYYLIAIVDKINREAEINESDNISVSNSTITISPTPSTINPSQDEVISNLSPVLSWSPISGASGYAIIVRDNNDNVIYSSAESGTSHTIPAGRLNWNSTYTWFVAVNNNGSVCPSASDAVYSRFRTACQDTYEPNNTYSAPNNSAFGTLDIISQSKEISSFISKAGDVDYFKVTAPTSGKMTVKLYSMSKNYDLELHTGDYANKLKYSTNTGTADDSFVYEHIGGVAEYLIKVYSYNREFDCNDDYKVEIIWEPSPNGSVLQLVQDINSVPKPLISPSSKNNIGVQIQNNSNLFWNGKLRFELLDQNKNLVRSLYQEDKYFSTGATFNFLKLNVALIESPGNYYIRAAYSDDGNTWNTIKENSFLNPAPVQIVDTGIRLSKPIEISPATLNKGSQMTVTAEVENFNLINVTRNIALQLATENETYILDIDRDDNVALQAEGANKHTLSGTITLTQDIGQYKVIVLAEENGTWTQVYKGDFQNPLPFSIVEKAKQLKLTNPLQTDVYNSGDEVTINWVADEGINDLSFELWNNNKIEVIKENVPSTNGILSFNLAPCLASGQFKIKAYETGTGNYESYSQVFTVNQDTNCNCDFTIPSSENGDSVELITAVNYLCKYGIINESSGDARPNDIATTAEISKVVSIALMGNNEARPSDAFPSPFLDLQNKNDWFYGYGKFMSYLEYGDGISPIDRNDEFRFRPNDGKPRNYVMKIILEAFNIQLDDSLTEQFTDVDTSTDAYKYITKASDLCIIEGNNGQFRPNDNITRGELFIIIYRLLTRDCALQKYTKPVPTLDDYYYPGNSTVANFDRKIGIEEGNFNHFDGASFAIGGAGIPLVFAHEYNSFLTDLPKDYFPSRPLGYGWSHTYNSYAIEAYVRDESSNSIKAQTILFYPSGQMQVWNNPKKAYPYECTAETKGVYDKVTYVSSTKLEVKMPNQVVYAYEKMPMGTAFTTYMLTEIKDRIGHTIKINYEDGANNKKRIASVVKDLGNSKTVERTLNFTYSSNSNYISSVKLNVAGEGNQISYGINADGDLKAYTDRGNKITEYLYIKDVKPSADKKEYENKKHLLMSVRLPKTNTITNTYKGRKLNSTEASGKFKTEINITPNYNNGDFGVTSNIVQKDETGVTTLQREVKFDKENLGRVQCVSENGLTNCLEYKDANHPYSPTLMTNNNTGAEAVVRYYPDYPNVQREEIYIEGRLANSTPTYYSSHTYNEYNDLLTTTNAEGIAKNDYGADPSKGLVYKVTDQEGNVTTLNYYLPSDGLWKAGLRKSITSAENITVELDYDLYGNPSKTKAPGNRESKTIYDAFGRPTTSTNANGQVNSFKYYPNGIIKEITNPRNKTNFYMYDDNYNLTSVRNERGQTTNLDYDFDTDLLKSTEFAGNKEQYEHYSDGRVKKVIRPDGSVITPTYVASGNGIGQIKNDGFADFTYDSSNRLSTITKTNGGSTYKNTIGYDNLNRKVKETVEVSGTSNYSYSVGFGFDHVGRMNTISYPKGVNNTESLNVLQRYYKNGWIKEIEDWEGQKTTIHYRKDGSRDYIVLPNGIIKKFIYDSTTGRLIGKKDTKANGDIIINHTYVLDSLGNIKKEVRFPKQDLVHKTITHNVTISTDNNFVKTIDGKNVVISKNGNVQNDGTRSYQWDEKNDVLTSVDGTKIAYHYDGLGRKRARTGEAIPERRYIHDGVGMSNIIAEMDENNNVLYYYIYLGNELLYRKKVNGTQYENQYYHSNFQGSTIAITDEQSNVTHSYAYTPYGKVVKAPENDDNPFTYIGIMGVMQEVEDFYHMRARFYDAKSGRFISQDPIWSTNLYSYAGGNPVMFFDPTGNTYEDIKYCSKYDRYKPTIQAVRYPIHVKIYRNAKHKWEYTSPQDKKMLELLSWTPYGRILQIPKYFNLGKGVVKGSKWIYGGFKSSKKWANQLTKRGWTEKQIGEAIANGKQFNAVNNVNKANSATRYVHPITEQSVVIDDVTKELLHIGGKGFKY